MACSQTLQFLVRDRRARVENLKKPPGIYRPPAQGVGVGKGENILLFFFRARCRTLASLTHSPNNRRKKKGKKNVCEQAKH